MSFKQRDPTTDWFARTSTPQPELKTSPATEWKSIDRMAEQSSSASEDDSSNQDSMKAAQLRIIKLKWELQLVRTVSTSQTEIWLIHDKVIEFKWELAFKNLMIIFKLEESSNYDVWQDKALIQILAIKAKNILWNFKMTCSESTMNSEDRWI